jgi:predicted component of type VI protein secretion system
LEYRAHGNPYAGYGIAANGTADTAVSWEHIADSGERHVIQRASLELESERFDETVAALRQIAPSVDGYIESEMLTATGRPRLTIVLRVPAARFEEVLRHVESLADIRTQNQWADDVTDHFHDMAGNLATRRIEEERILALIDQATDIHELLSLESRLSNVRHAIESYLSQLNHMAGQIAYSTITVTLTCSAEPPVVAGKTLGDRIGGAFGESVDGTIRVLQGIVVFLAGAVIPLVLLGLVGALVYKVARVIKRKVSAT